MIGEQIFANEDTAVLGLETPVGVQKSTRSAELGDVWVWVDLGGEQIGLVDR